MRKAFRPHSGRKDQLAFPGAEQFHAPYTGGNIANESRISIPFFLTPRFEIRLSEKYTSGSYLEERLKLITGQA